MKKPSHALFAFGPIGSLRLQKTLATHLIEKGWTVTFLLWEPGKEARERASLEIASLASLVQLEDFATSGKDYLKRVGTPFRLSASILLELVKRERLPPSTPYHLANAEASLDNSISALRALSPSVVVVSEDGFSANFHFIGAVKQQKIPIVDVPYGFHAGGELDIDLKRKEAAGELIKPEGTSLMLLRAVARQWLKSGAHKGAVMFPPEYILAAYAVGARVPNPWTIHGGVADALCVESDAAYRHYQREGVPNAKMVIVGSPYADEIKKSISSNPEAEKAFREPKWIDARPKVLVSWFPNYHDQRGHSSEYASYEEMTSDFFSRLREVGVEVTLSLHPACPSVANEIAKAKGLSVSTDSITQLIPRHDVYITYFSTTIRSALASGKPVLNYDAYKLDLQQFNAAGFINFQQAAGLFSMLSRLTSSPDEFRKVAAPQCAEAHLWGAVDGRSCDRIERILHSPKLRRLQ